MVETLVVKVILQTQYCNMFKTKHVAIQCSEMHQNVMIFHTLSFTNILRQFLKFEVMLN